MGFTAREYRAIQYVAKKRGWQLSLCQKPWVYFTYQTDTDDCSIRLRIIEVLQEYDRSRQEESRYKRLNRGSVASV